MAFVIIHFISIWWLATFLFGLLVFMHLFLYKIDGHSMLISQKKIGDDPWMSFQPNLY